MRRTVRELPSAARLVGHVCVMGGSVEVSLTTRPGRGCTVVQVAGELDMATEPDLKACLMRAVDAGARCIVLDLAGVRFIDSSALGTIVLTYKALQQRAGRLCLAAAQPLVLRVLGLTSVDRLVGIYPSVEAAEADLAAAGGER
jgi:anti-sigma B factor antagonist